MLAESQTTLEICPTSNLHTRASPGWRSSTILNTFVDAGVPITINTDGTYLCDTHLNREFEILGTADVLSAEQLEAARTHAFEASFL